MRELEIPTPRMMGYLALLIAHQKTEEMGQWLLQFRGKEDTLTAQNFTSQVKKITGMDSEIPEDDKSDEYDDDYQ